MSKVILDDALSMSDSHEDEQEQLASIEHVSRNLQLQSDVDRYRVEEAPRSTADHVRHYLKKQCSSLTFVYCLNALLEKIPFIRCLKEYNIRKDLFGDIVAGITVAIMHVPQGMAYGVLTTLPPVHGLYVSFYPVIVYMIFGTCPHLSIGKSG